jgi:RNA polymerase sigma-70 factor (ECF subfamily)
MTDKYGKCNAERGGLVARAQQGDREAFDALAQSLRAGLRGIAFVRTGDLQEADDLTQDALLQAWLHIRELKEPSSFLPWLQSILYRACSSWQRRHCTSTIPLDTPRGLDRTASHGPQPIDVVFQRLREEELRCALRTIPQANRIALIMAVWGGNSYSEIAEFTGVPVSTVEGRIHRAKSQMRRQLRYRNSDWGGAPPTRWGEPKEKEKPK